MPADMLTRIKDYCKKYDIALKYLIEVISDLKVIPMIRGKSFEYTVSDRLRNELSNSWEVKNLNLNAQQGNHDIDVLVERRADRKKIKVECKLTKNDSFSIRNNRAELRVKCMRSRTFSDNAAASRMAQHYGVSKSALLIHADSYRQGDFDFVITSLGNSLWTTIDEVYTFDGKKADFDFLHNLFPEDFTSFSEFQQQAYNFLLIAKSSDLIVSQNSNLKCTRKKCKDSHTDIDCGFIPNYPIVNLNDVASGNSCWKTIANVEQVFNNHLN